MKSRLTSTDYVEGILAGDTLVLSKAISVIESKNSKDKQLAADILDGVMPYTGNSLRIGITGAPGVGKSTFINTFGQEILKNYQKLAVLAIDPSSTKTKGSIMGDGFDIPRITFIASS